MDEPILALARSGPVKAEDVIALGVSRATATRRLRAEVEAGRLERLGGGRSTSYRLAAQRFRWKRAGLAEDEAWKKVAPQLAALGLSHEDEKTLSFVFTELVNNAIDHSEGSKIDAVFRQDAGSLVVEIDDDGVGVFEKVRRSHALPSLDDAIVQLEKGKLTSAPAQHSGQGIFFSSKAPLQFRLVGGTRMWIVDNERDERAIQILDKPHKGTHAELRFKLGAFPELASLFEKWSPPGEDFHTTRTTVKLAAHGATLISRSEAKRVVLGLEKFSHAYLDFNGVETIGQGFADEVFRVFADANAGVALEPVNMNPSVEAMVHRALVPRSALERRGAFLATNPERHKRAMARIRAANQSTTSDGDAALLAATTILGAFLVDRRGAEERLRDLFAGPFVDELIAFVEVDLDRLIALDDVNVSSERARLLDRAAALAIAHVGETHALWRHFANDEAIRAYWRLPADERGRLWGAPLVVE